jgi:hypothetical protein
MKRRAVSLLELILAMSACTVILTLSAALLHRIMHAQSRSREFQDVERSALRLAQQFRHDVHAATDAFIEADLGEGRFLRLQLAGERAVEYRRSEGAVLRIVLEAGNTRGREEFAFPANIELTMSRDPPRLITLSIASRPEESAPKDQSPAGAFDVRVNLQASAALNRAAAVADSFQQESP